MADAEDGANICIGSPVSEEDIAEFVKEMDEKTIPEIVKTVERREKLAEKSRRKIIQ